MVEAGTPAVFPGDSRGPSLLTEVHPAPLVLPVPSLRVAGRVRAARVLLQSCLVHLLAHGGQLVSGSFAPGLAGGQMGGRCPSRLLTLGLGSWVATNHLFPVYSSRLCVHAWPAVFSDSNMRPPAPPCLGSTPALGSVGHLVGPVGSCEVRGTSREPCLGKC